MARGFYKTPESRARALANLKPCKPGETHNPNGRPKDAMRLTNALRAILDEEVPEELRNILIPPRLRKKLQLKEGITWKELLAMRAVLKAAGGDTAAFREVADRDEGKPKQRIELMGSGEENEIRIRVIYEEPKK